MDNIKACAVSRYMKVIEKCAKICQLEREVKNIRNEIDSLLTVSEMKMTGIDHESMINAFNLVDSSNNGISVIYAPYVESKLLYKDISIKLHSRPGKVGINGFRNVLTEAGVI